MSSSTSNRVVVCDYATNKTIRDATANDLQRAITLTLREDFDVLSCGVFEDCEGVSVVLSGCEWNEAVGYDVNELHSSIEFF